MNAATSLRPQLKTRRVNLDTGRENVVVISRRSTALRPEVFRGFSRVELRRDSKSLLATLLLTDDDNLVRPDELGMAEPAFRRFAEPAGSKHDFDQVVIALGSSPLSLSIDGKPPKTTWARGDVQFIGRGVPHEAKNTSSKPVDFVIVAIK